jgi:hypothetical protein
MRLILPNPTCRAAPAGCEPGHPGSSGIPNLGGFAPLCSSSGGLPFRLAALPPLSYCKTQQPLPTLAITGHRLTCLRSQNVRRLARSSSLRLCCKRLLSHVQNSSLYLPATRTKSPRVAMTHLWTLDQMVRSLRGSFETPLCAAVMPGIITFRL